MSTKKKNVAREDEDNGFLGLTGTLEQNLRRLQLIREQRREEEEERDEAEELGISVFELRKRKYYEANKPILIDPASIESTKLKWLWPERIPLGKITVFSGDPGLGKSYVALDIAARVSHGSEWPDAEEEGRGEKEGGSEEANAENAEVPMVSRESERSAEEPKKETGKKEEEGEMGKEERDRNAQHAQLSTGTCADIQNSEKILPVQAPALSNNLHTAGVLVISSEDDKSDTILPRLELLGANLSNFRFLNDVKNDGDYEMFSITRHIHQLEIAIHKVKNCKLVIIDPLASYLDNMGGNSLSAVRKALDPLKNLAARCGVAVILINHLNKKSGAAIHRSAGSISIVGIARTVWGFTHCKHDQNRRLMIPLKNNLADDSEGLAYSITSENGLAWDDEPIEIRADEAFGNQEKIRGRNPYALREAMDWLRCKLSSGEPVPQTTIEADAREAGISERTLRRARGKIGVVTRQKQACAGWYWNLDLTVKTGV